jgi:hypothetical protein
MILGVGVSALLVMPSGNDCACCSLSVASTATLLSQFVFITEENAGGNCPAGKKKYPFIYFLVKNGPCKVFAWTLPRRPLLWRSLHGPLRMRPRSHCVNPARSIFYISKTANKGYNKPSVTLDVLHDLVG